MPAPVRFELNSAGMRGLLRDPTVGSALLVMAGQIARRASGQIGEDIDPDLARYEASARAGGTRARAIVYTANTAARVEEPVHRWLLNAFGAGVA
jgi:hypothetical protein